MYDDRHATVRINYVQTYCRTTPHFSFVERGSVASSSRIGNSFDRPITFVIENRYPVPLPNSEFKAVHSTEPCSCTYKYSIFLLSFSFFVLFILYTIVILFHVQQNRPYKRTVKYSCNIVRVDCHWNSKRKNSRNEF